MTLEPPKRNYIRSFSLTCAVLPQARVYMQKSSIIVGVSSARPRVIIRYPRVFDGRILGRFLFCFRQHCLYFILLFHLLPRLDFLSPSLTTLLSGESIEAFSCTIDSARRTNRIPIFLYRSSGTKRSLICICVCMFVVAHPLYYLRTCSSSFSLPSCNSDSESLSRLFSHLPTTVCAFCFTPTIMQHVLPLSSRVELCCMICMI